MAKFLWAGRLHGVAYVLNINVLHLKQEQSDIDKTIMTASSQALEAAK